MGWVAHPLLLHTLLGGPYRTRQGELQGTRPCLCLLAPTLCVNRLTTWATYEHRRNRDSSSAAAPRT